MEKSCKDKGTRVEEGKKEKSQKQKKKINRETPFIQVAKS